MRPSVVVLGLAAFAALLSVASVEASTAQFAVFPKANELLSPDGRFAVRSIDRQGSASDILGTFHSLWLFERSTGRSRKLCDYVGVVAAGWSSNSDWLVVTEYVGKRTSRAEAFSTTELDDAILVDTATLTRLVPVELRPALRENDHVFVEGSRVEKETFYLAVWGYGQHDQNGFRWGCEYALRGGTVSCAEEHARH